MMWTQVQPRRAEIIIIGQSMRGLESNAFLSDIQGAGYIKYCMAEATKGGMLRVGVLDLPDTHAETIYDAVEAGANYLLALKLPTDIPFLCVGRIALAAARRAYTDNIRIECPDPFYNPHSHMIRCSVLEALANRAK